MEATVNNLSSFFNTLPGRIHTQTECCTIPITNQVNMMFDILDVVAFVSGSKVNFHPKLAHVLYVSNETLLYKYKVPLATFKIGDYNIIIPKNIPMSAALKYVAMIRDVDVELINLYNDVVNTGNDIEHYDADIFELDFN